MLLPLCHDILPEALRIRSACRSLWPHLRRIDSRVDKLADSRHCWSCSKRMLDRMADREEPPLRVGCASEQQVAHPFVEERCPRQDMHVHAQVGRRDSIVHVEICVARQALHS